MSLATHAQAHPTYVAGTCMQRVTTQGGPIPVAIYGVAVLPALIELMYKSTVKQKWCAADGTEAGRLENLLNFFEDLSDQGKHFGYIKLGL